VARDGASLRDGLDEPRLDTPDWLWRSWWAVHGPATYDIAAAHAKEAPLDLSPRDGAAPPEGAVLLPTGTWRLPAGTSVPDLPGYVEGAFWVQDAAAALPARLLAPQAGEAVIDLCAAPGGKTAQLAAAGAAVVAVERDPRRMLRLRENFSRLGLSAEFVEADAGDWRPERAAFDAVLLDAPCTATGIIRRHPDIPHLKRASDVAPLAAAQALLLRQAVTLLRPGGRLVFATCSLQPEEGEAHLPLAASLGLLVDPVRDGELPGLDIAITPEGALRTRPDHWAARGGMDGFFCARFVKR
jgi:16S rRNA (cytosine967-C5)-methyltransferase